MKATAVDGKVPGMDVGGVIARRELSLKGKNYEVLIERPWEAETGDFVCPWSLVDDTGAVVTAQRIYGIDSAQALLLALLVISERVAAESDEFTTSA